MVPNVVLRYHLKLSGEDENLANVTQIPEYHIDIPFKAYMKLLGLKHELANVLF